VQEALKRITKDLKSTGRSNASVFILGRYNFNRDWVPSKDFPGLHITYLTIHGSKGLESDYVVVVNLESGKHGLPSEIEDDPILNLAMSELEKFEHAEERRLLYVALTRAKKQAFLVTRQNRDSMFAVELMSDSLINVVNFDSATSENVQVQTCIECKKGVMVIRSGPYSKFFGCSRFPECIHKMKIK
jgi:DNA helicase-4